MNAKFPLCFCLGVLLCFPVLAQVKPPIKGLLDRNRLPAVELHPYFGGFVVNAYWKDLQPDKDGALVVDNVIKQAIDKIRNTPSARHMKLKVRIFSGQHAPEWVKNLGGGPVYMGDNYDDVGPRAVPRWWEDEYQAKYASLLEKLSAKYDTVPEVAEFTISGCMTIYAEPLLRSIALKSNRVNLLNAGYTVEKDMAAHRKTIQAHQVFEYTPSSIALNPYQYVTEDTVGVISTDSTIALMNEAYEALCGKVVLGNNSLRMPLTEFGTYYIAMYEALLARHANVYFQTATPERVGNLPATLQWAIDAGALYVELPASYRDATATLTPEQLDRFNQALQASPATDSRTVAFADFVTSTDSICAGETFQLRGWPSTGANSFAWEYPGAILVEDRWHPYVKYATPGTYPVTLIAAGDCNADTITYEVVVQDCSSAEDVEEEYIEIAPNPFVDNCSITVHHSRDVPLEVVVRNSSNQVIYQWSNHRTNRPFYLGARWRPGTYFMEVAYADQQETVRLVKE